MLFNDIFITMKTKSIISELIEFKKKYHLKQKVLATMMEINVYTLNRWLKSSKEPGPYYSKHIAKFLSKNNS